MKKWDAKKLIISTVIFLFGVMAYAPLPAEAATVSDTVKITKEAIMKSAIKAPLVNLLPPKVVKMDNLGDEDIRGSRVFIREVEDSQKVMNALLRLSLDFDDDIVNSTNDGYGAEDGAYVNLGATNMMTGMLNVDRIDPSVSSRVQAVLDNPEAYGVNPIKLNIQVMPKVIEVATVNIKNEMSKHHILAMDPAGTQGSYDKTDLKHMLNRAYVTFKSYTDIMERRGVKGTEVNTGFWGAGEEGGSPVVGSVIQMMAAQLAGVDQLTFHYANEHPGAVEKAQEFLDSHKGQSVTEILDSLTGL